MDYIPNKVYYIILNLGLFIYNEFHIIIGNFLRLILSKIIGYKYIFESSSEEYIKYYLFGKKFLSFNIKQVIYLLDINNYKKHYKDLKNEFNNIDAIQYIPSNDFMNMFKILGLDISVIDINNKNEIANLFKEKYLHDDIYINVPNLYNCCEKYELGKDEDLINLINSTI